MISPEAMLAMRAAYGRGENVMACAREFLGSDKNEIQATLLAYDLQAGSYVRRVQTNPADNDRWCDQLAEILCSYVATGDRIMEVGSGEATTLAGVLNKLGDRAHDALGFDISWSRCSVAQDWLASQKTSARIFVADLFSIPLENSSVDIIYTSHSLEPNGGREEEALAELLRVARKTVVLVEPAYELATEEARERMRTHGYVRNLKQIAENLGGQILDYRLLPFIGNPLNPSGVLVIQKTGETCKQTSALWQCPYTATTLADQGDLFFSPDAGLAYPVLRGIPLLRSEHAVVASKLA